MGTVLHFAGSKDIGASKSGMLHSVEFIFQWKTKETFTIKERRKYLIEISAMQTSKTDGINSGYLGDCLG